MDLRWPPVVIAGLVCLLVCVVLAAWLPMSQLRRRMHPLAHTDRLTRLPEYARIVRLQRWTMIATVALLVAVFLAALLAGARPVGPSAGGRSGQPAPPEDIMLCVGAPVTDPVSAGFLNYFARQAQTYDTQRIGLTSATLRVVPLTLDHLFAAEKFSRLAGLAALQQRVDASGAVPSAELTALRTGVTEFSRAPDYLDYARSVEDTLALCMAGFPTQKDARPSRRSLVYWGDSTMRGADEPRPSLFSAQQIKDMAARAGIQIDVISRSDRPDPALRGVNVLYSIATAAGGSFEIYNSVGTDVDTTGGTGPALTATLNRIRADPPTSRLEGAPGAPATSQSTENPTIALMVALVMALLFWRPRW
jgi:hypothetical protein